MRILVTGATGLLGQELCPMLEAENWQFWATNSKIFDITNTKMVNEIINKVSLDFIIHLAGYTNVDQAEVEPKKAFAVNHIGTKNLAKIAKKLNVPILYVSTDMVFDGKKKTPYKTTDVTHPLCVYGESKLMGEKEIRKTCPKHYIIRSSWLYGRGGGNYVDAMLDFSSLRDEISVVDDQVSSPTWTKELCEQIIQMVKGLVPFGTHHICGGGQVNYSNFTKKIYEIKQRNTRVTSIAMSDFPRPAKRPEFSALDNSKILPEWDVSLEKYLATR